MMSFRCRNPSRRPPEKRSTLSPSGLGSGYQRLYVHTTGARFFRHVHKNHRPQLRATRLPSVWGDNPDTWNPDRFLDIDPTKQVRVGVFANL